MGAIRKKSLILSHLFQSLKFNDLFIILASALFKKSISYWFGNTKMLLTNGRYYNYSTNTYIKIQYKFFFVRSSMYSYKIALIITGPSKPEGNGSHPDASKALYLIFTKFIS